MAAFAAKGSKGKKPTIINIPEKFTPKKIQKIRNIFYEYSKSEEIPNCIESSKTNQFDLYRLFRLFLRKNLSISISFPWFEYCTTQKFTEQEIEEIFEVAKIQNDQIQDNECPFFVEVK